MNQDRIAGQWKQLKGKIKEKWGKLTDDDLTEPHRVCRRLHDLRGWSHEDIEELFTRGAGARDPDGA